ncbi:sensor histidine kinase [Microlunatus antarcticus]|uniref:histidine kinase n=1 Tax=Microlunatus antarcticus TaxID=53388 RepID=A0A7W5P6F0_9ACTN|nr:HAMP domain-containing sensor histidine kinase [Microlunatus antarcticus]MBB3325776.1 signal transduction histidine kinase [Microlunatus antarcticus]
MSSGAAVPTDGLRTRSLRNRVTITVLAFLAAMLVVLAVVTDVALNARLEGELRQRLQDRASYATILVGQRSSSQLVDALEGDGVSVRLTTASGQVIPKGPLSGTTGSTATPAPLPPGPAGGPKGPVAEQGKILSVTEQLSDGSTLVLLADSGDVQRTLDQVRTTLAVGGLVLLALAALALRPVVNRALRPLDQVTATARAITAGDRGARLRPDRPETELGQAASAFDAMLDEVEGAERSARGAEQRLRAFLSDAAHELRTPLAGVQAAAERLLRGVDDRAQREQLSVTVIREARRASRLADDLLTMARIDSGLELQRVPVDLSGVVGRVADVARLAHPAAQVEVLGTAGAVDADPDRVTQVLTNLVDNALAATRHQGHVTLTLARTPDAVTVDVADDGPGIPPADADRIFERLVRLDASRTSGGSGLGLSIARGIAEAHGGSLALVPSDAQGARFRLSLPTHPA